MSSPAKQAETEFDDLLGQLVDELAMTPAAESSVQLVPDPPAEVRVDSTQQMAAEAAAAAAAAAPPQAAGNNNLVKIVGIIAGSLTVVAIAAIAVFAQNEPSAVDEGPAIAAVEVDESKLDELAATAQAAAERAQAERMAAERVELLEREIRVEAGLLAGELEEQQAKQPKRRARKRNRPKPKPKPKPTPGDSFDDL